MISDEILKAKLKEIFKKDIHNIAPLSAARGAEIFRVTLEDHSIYVAKRANEDLELEAKMLGVLSDEGGMPVPKVYYASGDLLLMDYIPSDWQLEEEAQRNIANHLAKLHKVKGEFYGYEYDTPIWGVMQNNTRSDNWADFFAKQRIMPMIARLKTKDALNAKVLKKLDKLIDEIPSLIGVGNPPVLIHGDCWSGNILSERGEIKAFLDPAIYYADPEIELAYGTFTKTFDQAFFSEYEKVCDIKPGFFEVRRDLYTLYPLLIQTYFFGPSYARKIDRLVDKLL